MPAKGAEWRSKAVAEFSLLITAGAGLSYRRWLRFHNDEP